MAFRAGKRVGGLVDVALGCLLLRKTSSTPAVVPGAAPALAKARVGGQSTESTIGIVGANLNQTVEGDDLGVLLILAQH